jgi:type IV secretory pathway ATPase VirB11/archaellum biosynthesis ATPase
MSPARSPVPISWLSGNRDGSDGRFHRRHAVVADGRERTYRHRAPDLFGAAAAFAAEIRDREERLAGLADRDPLAAAREATGRAGRAAALATRTGLAEFVGLEWDALTPRVGPAWSHWRVRYTVPPGRFVGTRDLGTAASARIYGLSNGETRRYVLDPPTRQMEPAETATLSRAHDALASTTHPAETPRNAVRAVGDPDQLAPQVTTVLEKHVRDGGLLADLFADRGISDVFVTAPAPQNPVRVRVDGERMETNVYLTPRGLAALASKFRRVSGREFSSASPTLDASTTLGDRRVRFAGVTEPVSDGTAFAVRAHDNDPWRLSDLVANGTLSPRAAGLLSTAVERGASILIAGPRGSGKTTLLGALLWELPATVRSVVIEDAPELPVESLQNDGRDVQGLCANDEGPIDPGAALRSALRLGDGALVVGEVRGSEAGVLYEAMRIGAQSEAVLGTIHGDGSAAVLERVVSDLGVPASAFAATDLVVTLETAGNRRDPRRRVRAVEEVTGPDPVAFDRLFERTGEELVASGRLDRGNSTLLATLTDPADTYSGTLDDLRARTSRFHDAAEMGPYATV